MMMMRTKKMYSNWNRPWPCIVQLVVSITFPSIKLWLAASIFSSFFSSSVEKMGIFPAMKPLNVILLLRCDSTTFQRVCLAHDKWWTHTHFMATFFVDLNLIKTKCFFSCSQSTNFVSEFISAYNIFHVLFCGWFLCNFKGNNVENRREKLQAQIYTHTPTQWTQMNEVFC